MEKNRTSSKINALCARVESGEIRVLCFDKAAPLLSFAWKFCVLTKKKNSHLFLALWSSTMHQARRNNPELSIRDVESKVWVPVFQLCQELLQKLQDLSMTLGEVDSHFKDFEERDITTQLKLLFHGINECIKQQLSDHRIQQSVQKISEYWQLCSYRDAADSFLQLRDLLKLSEGDFRDVERISNEVISLFCARIMIIICIIHL